MSRLAKVTLDGPIDRMALKVALDKLDDLGWNAASVEAITPYSDGSVRIDGREWHTDVNQNGRPYSIVASANGYTEVAT